MRKLPLIAFVIGRGVFYGAATAEAQALRGESVFIVGAGNSAGRAAMHLARYAAQVTLLVRGESLAASMSEHLVQDLARTSNIAMRLETRVVGAQGDARLQSLTLEDLGSGDIETVPRRRCSC